MKEKILNKRAFVQNFLLWKKKKNSGHKELCSYMSFQTLSFQT